MKKLHFIFMALAMLTLSACNDDNSENFDRLAIYPLTTGAVITYADQTSDSVMIVSTKSWTLSSNSDWMGFGGDVSQNTVKGGATNDKKLQVVMLKNATDAVRASTIVLDNGDHKVGRFYYQTYWLNVTRPQVAFTHTATTGDDVLAQYNGAHFDLSLSKDTVSDHIDFCIYAAQATLTTDADWISPKEVDVLKGEHQVKLTFSKNTTGQDRRAVYTLRTSNGIATEIKVTQKGK
jgi:hypothetical protein